MYKQWEVICSIFIFVSEIYPDLFLLFLVLSIFDSTYFQWFLFDCTHLKLFDLFDPFDDFASEELKSFTNISSEGCTCLQIAHSFSLCQLKSFIYSNLLIFYITFVSQKKQYLNKEIITALSARFSLSSAIQRGSSSNVLLYERSNMTNAPRELW